MNSVCFTPRFNPNFTALRRAQYDCKNANGDIKPITIYEMEPRDIEYLGKFMDKLEMSDECKNSKDYDSRMEVTSGGVLDMYRTCIEKKEGNPAFDKTRMFMAFDGNKSCGFIMGNIPKKNEKVDNNIHYSARKESTPTETELDWFATWNEKGGEKLRGVGSALSTEFLISTEKDNFDNIFVQSEVESKGSPAFGVYGNFGFKELGKMTTERELFFYKPLLEDSNELDSKVIPMLLSKENKQKRISITENRRTELDGASVNLDSLA